MYAVIGGEGFLGQALVQGLAKKYGYDEVVSLGPTQRTFEPAGRYRFHRTDVTDYGSVYEALRASGCTCVFHTVSPHVEADAETSGRINVEGTRNIVKACESIIAIDRLVFTSTVTVLYGDEGLKCADDRLPTVDDSRGHYIRTKIKAEKMVLEANTEELKTVSIRCCGFFGPGDRQVIPGLMGVLKSHQTAFQLGYNDNLFDFMYVDNVVHAHILAAERLARPFPESADELYAKRLPPVAQTVPRRHLPTTLDPKATGSPADPDLDVPRSRFAAPPTNKVAGEAFSISNGEPVPFWSFLRACWAAYNGHEARFVVPIPVSLAYVLAYASEWFARARGLPPAKAGLNVAHASVVLSSMCMDIEKARRVLGYEPIVSLEEGIKRTIEWYKQDELKTAPHNSIDKKEG